MKKSYVLLIMLLCLFMTGCNNRFAEEEYDSVEKIVESEDRYATESNLLDKFLTGEINAEGNGFYPAESFHISELPQGEEWDSYSIGDQIDLDNDGEEELIINGPYGGMYLDSSADGVKVFAGGDGTASNLSYVHWNGETWIVHSDTMHSDRTYYKLEKYDGAENVVDSITLECYKQEENGSIKYYLNGNEVSETEYGEYYQNLFGDK